MSTLFEYVAKNIALSDAVTKNKRNTLADMIVDALKKADEAAVMREREACAVVAERWGNDDAADAIRARSRESL